MTKVDSQTSSNLRSALDGPQGELALTREPSPPDVTLEIIMRRKTFTGAINLAIDVSGLDDKEIYVPLKVDAAHWSRIRKGDAHFPVDKLNDLCDLVKNEIALIWWARSRGKGLHMLETEAERLLRVERDKSARLERDLEAVVAAFNGRTPRSVE